MKLLFILLISLLPLFSLAQQSDSQLAYTYYQNKEYDKAAQLFLQLYERTRSSNYLDYHIICLINGKQYDKAEEVLKKFLKTDDRNKNFLVNLEYIYEQQGKTKKSEEYYEKAIKKLIPPHADINSLAYKFRNIREYGWAIKTYLRDVILEKSTTIRRLNVDMLILLKSKRADLLTFMDNHATLLKARILSQSSHETEAGELLGKLKEQSEQTYVRAAAIFELAGLKSKMQQSAEAKELYKLLVSEYPGNMHSVEAGRLYRSIGND